VAHSATTCRTALVALIACLTVVPAMAGCGRKGVPTFPVRGTVTLDGMPVDGATVMFVPPAGPPNSAVTDSAGTFVIATPGVPAGVCGVTITKATGGAAMTNPTPEDLQRLAQNPAAAKPPTSALPEKFGRTETSGLSAEVTNDASKNVFSFDLKR
jgi:hypothetical protein